MVGAGEPLFGNDFASDRAEAPLHPVADDRAADFPGDRETDAHRRVRVLPIANEQDEAGGRRAQPAIGGEEVRATFNRA